MSTALDPNVTPLLVYAGIAVLVIASFVGAILVILGRLRAWLKVMFLEFAESKAFETTVERLLDRIADKMTSRLEARMTAIEERDKERVGSVARSFQQTDELGKRLDVRIDKLFDIQSRINTKEPTP